MAAFLDRKRVIIHLGCSAHDPWSLQHESFGTQMLFRAVGIHTITTLHHY
jgi:hypothetical protein